MNGLIIKDDARYTHLENYLRNCGHTFDAAKQTDFVIFPFKDEASDYGNGFFASLEKGTPVFSGIAKPELFKKCEKFQLRYHAMIDELSVATKNAVPTSEGVIAYLIANRNETIAAGRVLVIGYGICGSDLCKRLKALDASVYTLVRNREKESAAYANGIVPLYADEVLAGAFDVIVNTVPARVLPEEILAQTDALLIDIASSPYGFDIRQAKKRNEKSAILAGLPGKFAAKTAGEILGEYVNYVLAGEKNGT